MTRAVAPALVALSLMSAAAWADYTVVVDMAHPDELSVTLKLPKAEGAPHRLDVRGAAWGLQPQVHSAACGSVPLKQQKNGTWIADAACREVNWKVSPVVALDGAVDVSKHATLLFQNPRWLLLADPSSLLRLTDDTAAPASSITIQSGRTAVLGATPLGKQAWRVPSAGNAPEFFVVGDLPARSRTIGAFEVRYVADDQRRIEALGLEAGHERLLEYLGRVLPPPAALPASERTLLVVWIGIDERRGRARVAAGNRSLMANYVIGKPDAAKLHAAQTLMVLAQHQFRQLADLVRASLPPLPPSVNESLAAYYALKAVRTVFSGPEVESIRSDRIEFWTAIDDALGAGALDSLVPDLLRSSVEPGGRLPAAFVATLRARLGARTDALLAKYGGD